MSASGYFLLQRNADVPPGNHWLTADEQGRLAMLRVLKRRDDWRLGRWTAKRAVAAYVRMHSASGRAPSRARMPATCEDRLRVAAEDVASIEIRVADSGAPEVFLDGGRAAPAIALSHSGGAALCVVVPPGSAIGCDLETVTERGPAFATDYFTPTERGAIDAAAAPVELLTVMWSAKESLLKMLQDGLRADTRSVEVTVPVGLPAATAWRPLRACHVASGTVFTGWWRRHGPFVLTTVMLPAAGPPLDLKVAGHRHSWPSSAARAALDRGAGPIRIVPVTV